MSRIESRHNQKFKTWERYLSRPDEENCPWLGLEGWKPVLDLAQLQTPEVIIYSSPDDRRLGSLVERSKEAVEVSDYLFKRLSRVQNPQGILAFFPKPYWEWNQITPFVLYLDRLQDPGNLGTLFRTAAATGIFSVITSPGTVSCFNDKLVRASASFLFTCPFIQNTSVNELQKRDYVLWVAIPSHGRSLFETRLEEPLAIVLGAEATGTSDHLLAASDHQLSIPMVTTVDSLNAGVAGSLVMYEVFRQQSSSQ